MGGNSRVKARRETLKRQEGNVKRRSEE